MKRRSVRFGLSDGEWDETVGEVREAILTAARDRQMAWYRQWPSAYASSGWNRSPRS